MSAPTLWDWTEAAGAIAAALDDPEELSAALDTFLTDNADLTAKLDGYAGLIRDLEAKYEARKAEAARLAEIAKADAAKAETLKARLHMFMQAIGRDKLETAHYRLGIVKNGGKAPLLIENSETIPNRFWHERTVTELDTALLRDALATGQTVPGARLGDRGTRLSIR